MNLRLIYYDAPFTLERPDFTKWKPYAPAHDKNERVFTEYYSVYNECTGDSIWKLKGCGKI